MSTFSHREDEEEGESESGGDYFKITSPSLFDRSLWEIGRFLFFSREIKKKNKFFVLASHMERNWHANGDYSPLSIITLLASILSNFIVQYHKISASQQQLHQEIKTLLMNHTMVHSTTYSLEQPYQPIDRSTYDLYAAHVAREFGVSDSLVVAIPEASSKLRMLGILHYLMEKEGTWKLFSSYGDRIYDASDVQLLHKAMLRLYFVQGQSLVKYVDDRSILGTYEDARRLDATLTLDVVFFCFFFLVSVS